MYDWFWRHPTAVYTAFLVLTFVNFFGGHALALYLDPTGAAMVPIYGAAVLIVAAIAMYLVSFKKYPPQRRIFG